MTTITAIKKNRRPAFYERKFQRTRVYKMLWGQQDERHGQRRSNLPEIDETRSFDLTTFNYESANTFVESLMSACSFSPERQNIVFRRLDALRAATRASATMSFEPIAPLIRFKASKE